MNVISKQRSSEKICVLLRYFSRLLTNLTLAEDLRNRWKAHCFKGQWKDPFEALEASFKECFFDEHGFSLAEIAENRSYLLMESKITWICCDPAWILDNQDILVLDIPHQRNFSGSNGYYDHSALLLLKSK